MTQIPEIKVMILPQSGRFPDDAFFRLLSTQRLYKDAVPFTGHDEIVAALNSKGFAEAGRYRHLAF